MVPVRMALLRQIIKTRSIFGVKLERISTIKIAKVVVIQVQVKDQVKGAYSSKWIKSQVMRKHFKRIMVIRGLRRKVSCV